MLLHANTKKGEKSAFYATREKYEAGFKEHQEKKLGKPT